MSPSYAHQDVVERLHRELGGQFTVPVIAGVVLEVHADLVRGSGSANFRPREDVIEARTRLMLQQRLIGGRFRASWAGHQDPTTASAELLRVGWHAPASTSCRSTVLG